MVSNSKELVQLGELSKPHVRELSRRPSIHSLMPSRAEEGVLAFIDAMGALACSDERASVRLAGAARPLVALLFDGTGEAPIRVASVLADLCRNAPARAIILEGGVSAKLVQMLETEAYAETATDVIRRLVAYKEFCAEMRKHEGIRALVNIVHMTPASARRWRVAAIALTAIAHAEPSSRAQMGKAGLVPALAATLTHEACAVEGAGSEAVRSSMGGPSTSGAEVDDGAAASAAVAVRALAALAGMCAARPKRCVH
jgi:hypothetical protein